MTKTAAVKAKRKPCDTPTVKVTRRVDEVIVKYHDGGYASVLRIECDTDEPNLITIKGSDGIPRRIIPSLIEALQQFVTPPSNSGSV